jgi:TPR repeat protein
MFKLGCAYSHGIDAERDEASGAKWFLDAATAGHYPSQVLTAWNYFEGRGVPYSSEQVDIWTAIATANKPDDLLFDSYAEYLEAIKRGLRTQTTKYQRNRRERFRRKINLS